VSSDNELNLYNNFECLPRSGYNSIPSSTGFQTYFGGMYSAECFDLTLSPAPTLLDFDTSLPLSGTAFVPGTLALDIGGVYLISYEIAITSLAYTMITSEVLSCGKPLKSSVACVEAAKNKGVLLTHTTYARLSASDEIELQLTAEDREIVIIRQAQMMIMRIGT
jgi:hypothetical protein